MIIKPIILINYIFFFNDGRYVKKTKVRNPGLGLRKAAPAYCRLQINNGALILPDLKKVILGEAQNYPRSKSSRDCQLVSKRKDFHLIFFGFFSSWKGFFREGKLFFFMLQSK